MHDVIRWLRSHSALAPGAFVGVALALLLLSSIGGASAHVVSASATGGVQAPQSPVVPTVSGMSCALFGWDPCQSIGNAWNNFWHGVSTYLWNQVIAIFVYIYSAALGAIVGIFIAITTTIASVVIAAINGFAWAAGLMGIFALPFMTLALIGLSGGLLLLFDVVKDIPVVGAFT